MRLYLDANAIIYGVEGDVALRRRVQANRGNREDDRDDQFRMVEPARAVHDRLSILPVDSDEVRYCVAVMPPLHLATCETRRTRYGEHDRNDQTPY